MRVMVFYRLESDYAREVTGFLKDLKRQTGHELEEIDPDTAEGTNLANVYDIVEYPSMVAVSGDGVIQNMWRGLPLPTISEVGYYASLD